MTALGARLRRRTPVVHPARAVVLGFALVIAAGAAVLSLPVSSTGAGWTDPDVAIFTSTASVTLSGIMPVDTGTAWTGFGQAVILVLVQIGGFGFMTSAALLFVLAARRVTLRGRLAAQAEGAVTAGDTRRVVRAILVMTVAVEALAATAIGLRLLARGDHSAGEAAWHGAFHGVSAFNNAGISLFEQNLRPFATDPVVLASVAVAVLAGGVGFPVWLDLRRRGRTPRRWSLHTKLTLATTGALLLVACVGLTALEWANDRTLGGLDAPGRVLAGTFQGAMPRTAGFSVVPYDEVRPETLLFTDMLMFVGGGSGSTAGGIKVTTFALLFLIVWAELRGRADVAAFRRRIPLAAQRQALTIAVISINAVVLTALVVMLLGDTTLSWALFESVAAFSNAGLSPTTGDLPTSAQSVLYGLMFLGRVGPITLGVALVLRERDQLFREPEERPLVG